MRVNVTLASVELKEHTEMPINVEIECGIGDQVLRWLAFAACYRMANSLGEPVTVSRSGGARF